MFTGIIETTAHVQAAQRTKDVLRVQIALPKKWRLTEGQSVAIDGICSTVVHIDKKTFEVEYMLETLLKTTASSFVKGALINLERSLRLDTLIDGHLLQGHVDTRVRVEEFQKLASSAELTIEIPASLKKLVAPIGSIAINGVSLTVARAQGKTATIALIPYTLEHTNLGFLKKGNAVNIEVDMIARYLDARMRK